VPQPLNLFIIKQFHEYNGIQQSASGLRRSAQFAVDLLLHESHRAKLVQAIDGNCIDRLVTENAPTRVILEALWVTPAKMAELKKLHPSVKWTIRIHSEIPFLATEGIAVEWIAAYNKMGVEVAFNSDQTRKDFSVLGDFAYLPNYYPLRKPRKSQLLTDTFEVGCFGAIRPLKNQLIQAFAAIKFAKDAGIKLAFHMNSSRIEQGGENVLRQIRALFEATGQTLVVHPWLDHEDFLELIAEMHVCLQVSLSESFNIVSADAVSMGVPLVGSDTITWLPKRSKAAVDSTDSIVAAIERADATTVAMNHAALETYLDDAREAWNAWVTQ
jgi:hypothetical protein